MARPTTATEVASVASSGVMPTTTTRSALTLPTARPATPPSARATGSGDTAMGEQLGDNRCGKHSGRGERQVDAALHHVVATRHDHGGEAAAQDRQRHALLQDGGEILPLQKVRRLQRRGSPGARRTAAAAPARAGSSAVAIERAARRLRARSRVEPWPRGAAGGQRQELVQTELAASRVATARPRSITTIRSHRPSSSA